MTSRPVDSSFAVLIQALKPDSEIPDQLLKKLDGTSLLQRSIHLAQSITENSCIMLVCDSPEAALLGERNGVRSLYDENLGSSLSTRNDGFPAFLEDFAKGFSEILVLNPNAPLLQPSVLKTAIATFQDDSSELLVPMTRHEHLHVPWNEMTLSLFFTTRQRGEVYIESRAFFIIDAASVSKPFAELRLLPLPLDENPVEIQSYHDWWVCERLLTRKRIVFVVAGHAAIGMGHVFRSLMLAHEITEHEILFLCTSESELAVKNIASRDYKTVLQQGDLAQHVLSLEPDLVVNDFLATTKPYVDSLKEAGIAVVNFEDTGEGALSADLVFNALLQRDAQSPSHFCFGPEYFCLRDEFLDATPKAFTTNPQHLLISFGGTDPQNYTRYALESVFDLCQAHSISISIVAGPGYAFAEELLEYTKSLSSDLISFKNGTNVISSEMEQADIAITSAGRTIYELFHMRVPSIVLAQHQREGTHAIAQESPAVSFLGVVDVKNPQILRDAFIALLNPSTRLPMRKALSSYNFKENKHRVLSKILALLAEETPARKQKVISA